MHVVYGPRAGCDGRNRPNRGRWFVFPVGGFRNCDREAFGDAVDARAGSPLELS